MSRRDEAVAAIGQMTKEFDDVFVAGHMLAPGIVTRDMEIAFDDQAQKALTAIAAMDDLTQKLSDLSLEG